MSDFTPITTQAEFDAAIGDRIKREREVVAKKYADYEDIKAQLSKSQETITTLTASAEENAKKYAVYDNQMAELQGKIKGYETSSVKMRIAHEFGIPFEMAERLSGDSEESIREDAKTLAPYLSKKQPAPLKSTEPNQEDALQSAYRSMAGQLFGNN